MKYPLIFCLLLPLLTACGNQGSTLTADDLVGSYEYHREIVTRASGEVLSEREREFTHLNLSAGGDFNRVYYNGTWSVENNRLTLQLYPSSESSERWVYDILERRDNVLRLRRKVANGDRSWAGAGSVASDELLTITEEYLVREP